MEKDYFNKIAVTLILAVLIVFSFLVLRPILMSIIGGIILAMVFIPVNKWLNKKIKSPNLSAGIICTILIVLVLVVAWFLVPVLIKQSFKMYLSIQQLDITLSLQEFFPSIFSSQELGSQISNVISNFLENFAGKVVDYFSQFVLNLPTILLQLAVVLFTFFFVLRDEEFIKDYIKSLLPFSKDVEKKLFESSRGITMSVLYGQVIVGIIQGVIAGIGFFIFGVPNALFLTLISIIAGILPIVGAAFIWMPVALYLLVAGNLVSAIGVGVIGSFASTIDNFIRPLIVSQKTKLHTGIVFIGMIGGLFLFGILGLILGPLIIAYLLIILEIYRNKKLKGFFLQEKKV